LRHDTLKVCTVRRSDRDSYRRVQMPWT